MAGDLPLFRLLRPTKPAASTVVDIHIAAAVAGCRRLFAITIARPDGTASRLHRVRRTPDARAFEMRGTALVRGSTSQAR
jgi:hypothetical protein